MRNDDKLNDLKREIDELDKRINLYANEVAAFRSLKDQAVAERNTKTQELLTLLNERNDS